MNINFYRNGNAQGNLEAWKSCQITTDFCHSVRDVINHRDTAFLFIGYNHLGKKASTTGNLGKHLRLNLIIPAGNDNYTVTSKTNKPLSPNSIDKPINTPLTLPPHPNPTPAVRVVQ